MRLRKKWLFPSLIILSATLTLGSANITKLNSSPVKKRDEGSVKSTEDPVAVSLMEANSARLYKNLGLAGAGLNLEVFKQALTGYLNLTRTGKTSSSIVTIADLSVPSKQPRLWIIDVEHEKVLMHTYVAHGRGSGLKEALNFSDTPNSNQSSLGFYLTGETYQGKHGRSLRLDGMDKGFNTNARARGIVLHGAWYVGAHILKGQDRMGVSQGCPAVDDALSDEIIDIVKNGSTFFIHGESKKYASNLLNTDLAEEALLAADLESTQADPAGNIQGAL
jgi:hypothetical protein